MINRIKVQFNESVAESAFRNNSLNKDTFQGIVAFLLCVVPLLLFIISDFYLFGLSTKFFQLLFTRGIMLLIIILMIAVLKLSRRFIVHDIAVFLYWLVMTAGLFYIYSTRPGAYSPYGAYDIVAILSIYLLLPNRFILQLIPALIYSTMNLVFLLEFNTTPDPVLILRSGLSVLFANMLGIFLSWRVHYLRRVEYAALENEIKLSRDLESALKNVRTLSGLLPICSRCHKIRNDEGYWKRIDSYIEEHSEVQFTHGICNDCMDELYSKEDWYLKSKDTSKKS